MVEEQVRRRRTYYWQLRRRRHGRTANRRRRAMRCNTRRQSHPRGRRWWRKLSQRAKRRIRRMTTTAYQLKVDTLRKQLGQDVPVACWLDRVHETQDGTLLVSFGSGVSKPERISIASINIQGCKHTEKEEEQGKGKGADKLELLVNDFADNRFDILLLQHTGEKESNQLDLPAAEGKGIKYFVHGVEQENNRIHGGVGILLGRKATRAW